MSSSEPPPVNAEAPVSSPCTGVCRMDAESGWCRGCLRTIDEIAAWSTLDDSLKIAVWSRLAARRAVLSGAARADRENG